MTLFITVISAALKLLAFTLVAIVVLAVCIAGVNNRDRY